MYLRELKMKDAPLMLEWMHDKNVVENLYTDFSSKSILDCEEFINSCSRDSNNIHMAIVSDNDEYMGTVSLKHIDLDHKNAEFAITIRYEAMGQGYSWFAMTQIIEKAFGELELDSVYWCVSKKNKRAVCFYDKHDLLEDTNISREILERYHDIHDLKWYSISRADWSNKKQ